jgi:hypothetical protein
MRMSPLLTLAVIGTGIGCDARVEHREDNVGAVWSDDGLEVAMFHRSYSVAYHDGLKGGQVGTLLDVSFTPQIRDQASTMDRPIGEPREGDPWDLYLMRSAGFIVLSFQVTSGNDVIEFFERVDLATGQSIALRPPCHRAERISCEAIPSPDGSLIALVERATGESVRIELRRASDLGVVAMAERPTDSAGASEQTWHPDGSFLFSVDDYTHETWRLTADGALDSVAPPACFAPQTTSSSVDTSGRILANDGTLSQELGKPFGCQAGS